MAIDEIAAALASGEPLSQVPSRVASRRSERAGFAVAFSREATDTMLAGADPVAGTLRKSGADFQRKLESLYRDVPEDRAAPRSREPVPWSSVAILDRRLSVNLFSGASLPTRFAGRKRRAASALRRASSMPRDAIQLPPPSAFTGSSTSTATESHYGTLF